MSAFLGNELVQSQQMGLAPKLIEELKILQMSNIELMQYVEEQLVENPLLEAEIDDLSDDEPVSTMDVYGSKDYDPVQKDSQKSEFGDFMSQPQTLSQHLLSQLGEIKMPIFYRRIATYLIHSLDQDGYLTEDVQHIVLRLKISAKEVNIALKIIQGLEPFGVGARSLKESLLIQLYKRGLMNEKIKEIIIEYLELLAERKYKEISHKTGLAKEQIIEIHALIKCLNPKPGREFDYGDGNLYITPEIELKDINGEFFVILANERVLNLKVSEYYKRLIGSEKNNKETTKYIKAKLSKAVELINAVEQRKKTILNVAKYIVEYQTEFFKKGHKYLKSLTMKNVADKVGVHESTVSRTVNDKFIHTPQGTFELKFFFSSQADSISEFSVSSNGVKKIILNIIKNEDKSKPLSDEKIKKELENKKIHIARRTVAKYREFLDILPAIQRKLNWKP